MTTAIIVACTAALIQNKISTKKFFTSLNSPPIGTTWNTKLEFKPKEEVVPESKTEMKPEIENETNF